MKIEISTRARTTYFDIFLLASSYLRVKRINNKLELLVSLYKCNCIIIKDIYIAFELCSFILLKFSKKKTYYANFKFHNKSRQFLLFRT